MQFTRSGLRGFTWITMASSGDDLEEDMHGGHDGGGKKGKKFLQPFRKMRRFFSSRRRAKSREEETEEVQGVAVKSKSTTDVLRASGDDELSDDESGQFVPNKTLSMSADSVFTPDPRTKDITTIEALQNSARSMEHLGQPAFTNELFQKLKSRRGEDDDGLPSSPVTQSTQDVLDDFKKPHQKRHDSKHSIDSSMYSSEDELEEKNVFEQEWAVGMTTSRQNVSAMTDSSEALDFSAVSSTTSLANNFAHHKISIKPKNVRPSTQHRRTNKPSAAKPLPQVEEKEETRAEDKGPPKIEPTVEVIKEDGNEAEDENEAEEAMVEIQVTADVEAATEQKRQSADSSRDADEEDEVVESADSEEEEAKPVAIIIPMADTKASPRASPVPPPKSPKPQKKSIETRHRKSSESEKVPEDKEAEPAEKMPAKDAGGAEESKPFNVVLRKTGRRTAIEEMGTIRMRDNVVDRDPSKRQTIAGDAGLASIFGERKPGNRSSFAESSRSPEPKEESGNNEFSQVLNRLKKQPSRKKLIPNEDEAAKSAESGNSVDRKTSQASKEKSVVVESKPKVLETKAKMPESKPKAIGGVTPQKSTENKPKVPEGKPKIAENKPRFSENKPKIDSKPSNVDVKAKISESKPVLDHSPKSNESKSDEGKTKPKVIINKTSEVSKPKILEVSKPKTSDVSKPKTPEVSKPKTPDVSKPKTPEVFKPKTPEVSKAKIPEVSKAKIPEVLKPKVKEVVIVKKSESVSPKDHASTIVPKSTLKSEPISEKKLLRTESKPITTSSFTSSAKSESSKPIVVEKAKPVEQPKKTVVVEKPEPKTPVKEEVMVTEKAAFKRETVIVKNRIRSQTLTEPGVQGANKENEKSSAQSIQRSNSQGDATNDKPTAKTTAPTEKPTGRASDVAPTLRAEPAWFTLARRKTANWDQKEKDLEQKDKKETSNIAEKERDASSKGKEVILTIDEAAKEDTKPALRAAGKCANSAANRQSKVLDMAKLFNQVS